MTTTTTTTTAAAQHQALEPTVDTRSIGASTSQMKLDYYTGTTSNTIDFVLPLLPSAVGWIVVLTFKRFPKAFVKLGGPELLPVNSLKKSVIEQYYGTIPTWVLYNIISLCADSMGLESQFLACCFLSFAWVLFISSVTGACPVTADLIVRVNMMREKSISTAGVQLYTRVQSGDAMR